MASSKTTTTPLQRDTAEFDQIEQTAHEIMAAFQERDPLQTVMALRLAAQMIYDTRCRERPGSGMRRAAEGATSSS